MVEDSPFELVVEFSTQMDTWGFVVEPDDFDFRSHDEIAQRYFDRSKHLRTRLPDNDRDLLIDFCAYLDNEGQLTSLGPTYEPDEVVDRFLKERPTRERN